MAVIDLRKMKEKHSEKIDTSPDEVKKLVFNSLDHFIKDVRLVVNISDLETIRNILQEFYINNMRTIESIKQPKSNIIEHYFHIENVFIQTINNEIHRRLS